MLKTLGFAITLYFFPFTTENLTFLLETAARLKHIECSPISKSQEIESSTLASNSIPSRKVDVFPSPKGRLLARTIVKLGVAISSLCDDMANCSTNTDFFLLNSSSGIIPAVCNSFNFCNSSNIDASEADAALSVVLFPVAFVTAINFSNSFLSLWFLSLGLEGEHSTTSVAPFVYSTQKLYIVKFTVVKIIVSCASRTPRSFALLISGVTLLNSPTVYEPPTWYLLS